MTAQGPPTLAPLPRDAVVAGASLSRGTERNPDAQLKYEKNWYDYTKSPWWDSFEVKAAHARVQGSREAVEFQHIHPRCVEQWLGQPQTADGVIFSGREAAPTGPMSDDVAWAPRALGRHAATARRRERRVRRPVCAHARWSNGDASAG